VSANARTGQTLTARQFCCECGTSEHSAPLTMPGAGSTVNINRGRRLGPPAKKQEISLRDSRQRGAVVLEMPVKSVDDAPVASELSPALESQYSAADLSPSRASAGHSDSDDPYERSLQSRSFWLAAIAVALLGVISGTVWYVRARHANFSDARPLVLSAHQIAPPAAGADSNATMPVNQPAGHDKAADEVRVPIVREGSSENESGTAPANASLTAGTTADVSANHSLREKRTNSSSPVELANRYLLGQGVPRSCDKAVSLLTEAAEKGNVRASNQIASMYSIGSCVSRDRVQAYRWLGASLAADPHNHWAQHNRDLLLSQMTTAELSRLKANR
jgi:TPR repeat protein